jgi:uncharacterized membrane protein
MLILLRLARIFFALDLLGFAIELFLAGHFVAGLPPIPPTVHASSIEIHGAAIFLAALAIGILFIPTAPTCALLTGLIYTGSALILHGNARAALLHDAGLRTSFLEALAIGAGALALFSIDARPPRAFFEAQAAIGWLAMVLFALTLIVFGYQHFEVIKYVASVIPRWIPQHTLMAQLTGVALILACIGLFVPRAAIAAGITVGAMFLLWALFLHIPRIAAHPHNRDEWISGIVCLAMADASWIIACGRIPRINGRF